MSEPTDETVTKLRRELVKSRQQCAELRKELKELRAATALIVNAIGQERVHEVIADSA